MPLDRGTGAQARGRLPAGQRKDRQPTIVARNHGGRWHKGDTFYADFAPKEVEGNA